MQKHREQSLLDCCTGSVAQYLCTNLLYLYCMAALMEDICRYASESTGTNITCSGTYAVLVDGCLILLEVA